MAYTDAQHAQAELDKELAMMVLKLLETETNHLGQEGQFASGTTALVSCMASLIAAGNPTDLMVEVAAGIFSRQLKTLIRSMRHG